MLSNAFEGEPPSGYNTWEDLKKSDPDLFHKYMLAMHWLVGASMVRFNKSRRMQLGVLNFQSICPILGHEAFALAAIKTLELPGEPKTVVANMENHTEMLNFERKVDFCRPNRMDKEFAYKEWLNEKLPAGGKKAGPTTYISSELKVQMQRLDREQGNLEAV